MNEILQKRIEKAARLYADKAIHYIDDSEEDMIKVMVDFTEQMLSHQWISVEEALPEFEGNFSDYYIIKTENGWCAVTMYYRTSEKEYWWNFEKVKVTHWMNIPSLEGGEE